MRAGTTMRRALGPPPSPFAVPPCDHPDCPGLARNARLFRYDGGPFGIAGRVCDACRSRELRRSRGERIQPTRDPATLALAASLAEEGCSVREAGRRLGVSWRTAEKLLATGRKLLADPVPCDLCGHPAAILVPGERWELEGSICPACEAELEAEAKATAEEAARREEERSRMEESSGLLEAAYAARARENGRLRRRARTVRAATLAELTGLPIREARRLVIGAVREGRSS